GHCHGFRKRDPSASMATPLRVHLDQPKQQLQSPPAQIAEAGEQAIGALTEGAGEPAALSEQTTT
ncbi:MAG TPA: hypothetical protein VFG47_00210, partial [Geminicoccaceae bacterium]|nr:hypothetical protein [Geminicoccaceae bacterium]